MSDPADGRTASRRRMVAALLVVIVLAGLIALTARDPGLTWDEAIYYGFAARYLEWFGNLSGQSFQPANLFPVWWQGQVHPPLGKLYIALSFRVFGGSLDLISAARVGAGLLFGLTAALIFLWGAERRNAATGLVAAAAFAFMPRIFGPVSYTHLRAHET